MKTVTEEIYRNSLDNLLEGCQIIGFDWRYLYINDVAARHNRRPKAELMGKKYMDMWPGIEQTHVFGVIRRCLEERIPHQMENEFTFPDGAVGWFELSIQPVPDGVFILSMDVTKRKLAELRVTHLLRLYATLSHVNQTIIHVKEQGELFRTICHVAVGVGKFEMAWIGMLDRKRRFMTTAAFAGIGDGRLPFSTIDMAEARFRNGLIGIALNTGNVAYARNTSAPADKKVWNEMSIDPAYHSAAAVPFRLNNETVGVLNLYAADVDFFADEEQHRLLEEMASDISFALQTMDMESRHRQAEESLRKSEDQFRLIAENVADLIAVLDLDGKRIYNSPSYKHILGDPELLKGTDSFREIHPEDRERIRGIFTQTAKTGIGQRAEYRFLSSSGKTVYVESQGSAIRDKEGKIIQIVVVSRDVTEKKQLEKQFLRSQRIESIGTLAGGIAHDLNNVLAPILLSLEMLGKKLPDEQSQRTLNIIKSSATRGAELIKQVLSFARGVEGDRTIVQIRHLIEEVGKIVNETFPKSISFQLDAPKDLPTIVADATQLHQVLMNLCVNARDAMPDGGRIEVTAESLLLDEQYVRMHAEAKPGRYIVVTVTDRGIGMPPAVMERIFEPFFTTKDVGKGTGLGLSTVLAILKSHGGFVNVYSEVGKGTRFKVYLPAMDSAQVATREEQEILPSGNGELILVVDDEESIREITKATLEAFGYVVMTATDGTEAVAIFAAQKQDIALVLTDMMMPYMDGTVTIRALLKMKPSAKIIAMSGLKQGEANLRESGVVFLNKPFTSASLLKTIAEVLAGTTA